MSTDNSTQKAGGRTGGWWIGLALACASSCLFLNAAMFVSVLLLPRSANATTKPIEPSVAVISAILALVCGLGLLAYGRSVMRRSRPGGEHVSAFDGALGKFAAVAAVLMAAMFVLATLGGIAAAITRPDRTLVRGAGAAIALAPLFLWMGHRGWRALRNRPVK